MRYTFFFEMVSFQSSFYDLLFLSDIHWDNLNKFFVAPFQCLYQLYELEYEPILNGL